MVDDESGERDSASTRSWFRRPLVWVAAAALMVAIAFGIAYMLQPDTPRSVDELDVCLHQRDPSVQRVDEIRAYGPPRWQGIVGGRAAVTVTYTSNAEAAQSLAATFRQLQPELVSEVVATRTVLSYERAASDGDVAVFRSCIPQ